VTAVRPAWRRLLEGDDALERPVRIVVAVAIALGLVLRLWMVFSPLGPFDSDEAVAGLMGRHMLDGEFHTFYWDQPYGGTHEAFLLAVLFALRAPARLAMELVPIALSAATAVVVWRIGLRVLERRSAALAGALFWTTSAVFVWQSTKERSFYATTLLAGVAATLLALRLLDRPSPRDALLLGMAGGVGWHSSPNIVYLALPALVWLVADTARKGDLPRLLRVSWAAVVGVLVGALPWIYSNLTTSGASLKLEAYANGTTYLDRLELFAKAGFPYALGVQTPHEPISRPYQLLYLVVLVGLAVALVRLPRPAWGIGLGLILAPFIFAAFPPSWFVGEPRYLSFMWPFVVLVAAAAIGRLPLRSSLLVLAVLGAGTVIGTALMVHRSRSSLVADYSPGNLDPLVRELRANDVDRAFADYWIAYRLTLATGERIVASPVQTLRYQPYETQVRAAPNPPYLFYRESCYEEKFLEYLDSRDVDAVRTTAGRFSVVRPARRVLPEEALVDWASERGLAKAWVC
jgi:4-amino-4-deoxy-L-arabinose transferase-like glycosyltransferase